jgi:hypothetical protein
LGKEERAAKKSNDFDSVGDVFKESCREPTLQFQKPVANSSRRSLSVLPRFPSSGIDNIGQDASFRLNLTWSSHYRRLVTSRGEPVQGPNYDDNLVKAACFALQRYDEPLEPRVCDRGLICASLELGEEGP